MDVEVAAAPVRATETKAHYTPGLLVGGLDRPTLQTEAPRLGSQLDLHAPPHAPGQVFQLLAPSFCQPPGFQEGSLLLDRQTVFI